MRRTVESLGRQLHEHRVNSDVARAMREDRAQLLLEIEALLKDSEAKFQDAAAMHATGKVGHYGGRISALKDVLKII